MSENDLIFAEQKVGTVFFSFRGHTKTKKRFKFTVKKLLRSVLNVLSDKTHFFLHQN